MTLFSPSLLNGPFGDAALLLESARLKDAVLFDLGDLHTLAPKTLAKVSHVFVSHTHMDHFGGFEQLLRQNLNRSAPLYLYGPQNFIKQVKAKLQGFTWNLITDPAYTLEIIVTEVRPRGLLKQSFSSRNAFRPQAPPQKRPFSAVLLDTEAYSVITAVLDHGTPCLAFCLKEKARYNVDMDALANLGLQSGPWLKDFKTALAQNADDNATLKAQTQTGGPKSFKLEALRRLAQITPPYAVAYVTDLAYTKANLNKVLKLAHNCDALYIEAAFLNADAADALDKKHLTTGQSGAIIKKLMPKRWVIFHFSHKYQKMEERLWDEVKACL